MPGCVIVRACTCDGSKSVSTPAARNARAQRYDTSPKSPSHKRPVGRVVDEHRMPLLNRHTDHPHAGECRPEMNNELQARSRSRPLRAKGCAMTMLHRITRIMCDVGPPSICDHDTALRAGQIATPQATRLDLSPHRWCFRKSFLTDLFKQIGARLTSPGFWRQRRRGRRRHTVRRSRKPHPGSCAGARSWHRPALGDLPHPIEEDNGHLLDRNARHQTV